ncbi:hypothetical protein NLJ89_g548 [Agrocybe chaxingu]|uniref:HhH-GPD domain-containing protein n=1 Tax=Agrocybe chaxingu TaxID=84603 RepID=A0A9W8N1T4_9AGAR|nr:hypothetical protein NLJ89_g548 [Agrocybe chaxingu]
MVDINGMKEQIADDPWKLLVAVTLLNKTAGKLAIPVFWDIIDRWSTPLELSRADEDELISILRQLGTQTVRTKRMITLSRLYLQDPPSSYDPRPSRASSPSKRESRFFQLSKVRYPATPISHLPGAGSYALDSYRIFCTLHEDPLSDEWKSVLPTDKELIRYLKWKWAYVGKRQWSPSKGVLGCITPEYITSLITELENK